MNPRNNRPERPEVGTAQNAIPGTRLNLPMDKLDPTQEYQFIRASVHGQPDDDNIEAAMARGFVPVEHKEIGTKPFSMPGRESADPYVRRGGTIAMRRPKALADQERAVYAQDTQEQMRSAMREMDQFRAGADPKYLQNLPGSGVNDLGTTRGKFPDA